MRGVWCWERMNKEGIIYLYPTYYIYPPSSLLHLPPIPIHTQKLPKRNFLYTLIKVLERNTS